MFYFSIVPTWPSICDNFWLKSLELKKEVIIDNKQCYCDYHKIYDSTVQKFKSNCIKWIVINKRLTINSLQCLWNLCYCHLREKVPLDSLVIDANLLGIISRWHKLGNTTFTPRTFSSMTTFIFSTTKGRGYTPPSLCSSKREHGIVHLTSIWWQCKRLMKSWREI